MNNVRNLVLLAVLVLVLVLAVLRGCDSCTPRQVDEFCRYAFASYNPNHPVPAGTPESQIFRLSQDYPLDYNRSPLAWEAIPFDNDRERAENSQRYADAVLSYCLEGNTQPSIDFKVQDNPIRKWYHVPWLHWTESGREWRHGLTRERTTPPGDIHPNQTQRAFSWAIGFYNDRGGYTVGKVWDNCGKGVPNPQRANFPNGTVTFKLLFTSANTSQVPFLVGAKEWTVNTDGPINNEEVVKPGSPGWVVRRDQVMRLLQIDIAVKDSRVPTGWVFGTFVYDGTLQGADIWRKFKLVGLSWGLDEGNRTRITETGAFINPSISESWINPQVLDNPATADINEAIVFHLGLGGRMNGPVDNAVSSCISCHAKAAVFKDQAPENIEYLGHAAKSTAPASVRLGTAAFNDYFGTETPAGTGDITYNCFVSSMPGLICSSPSPAFQFVKTDYSLQLAIAIENYYDALHKRAKSQVEMERR